MQRLLTGIALAALPRATHAQTSADATRAVREGESRIDLTAGVGIEGFIDSAMRDAMGAGVSWSVRGAHGNPQSVRVELAYTGSRQSISLMNAGGMLVGHGVTGLLRINVYPDTFWEPFFFVGAGWSRFSVSDRPSTSPLPEHDDVLEMPIGIAAEYRHSGVVFDLRIGFRVITGPDLLADPSAKGSEDDHMMHRFGITSNLGYSF